MGKTRRFRKRNPYLQKKTSTAALSNTTTPTTTATTPTTTMAPITTTTTPRITTKTTRILSPTTVINESVVHLESHKLKKITSFIAELFKSTTTETKSNLNYKENHNQKSKRKYKESKIYQHLTNAN